MARNVAAVVKPPKAVVPEVEILSAADVARLLTALKDDPFYPVVALALATGMRRGELLALRWADIDLAAATLNAHSSRRRAAVFASRARSQHTVSIISLPPSTVEMLQDYRKAQLEQRMRLGLGKPDAEALVFGKIPGGAAPFAPKYLSVRWRRATRGLVDVTFHALRHSHASALIAGGVDVVTVSRRLGHSSPTITLNTYAHLYRKTDTTAAEAIEATLRGSVS